MSERQLQLVRGTKAGEGHEDPADDALMLAAAADDRDAFALLVRRYEAQVRRYTTALLRDEQRGRDAAQEVFLRLWARRARYRPNGRFRPFLFTVARNHCRSLARRQALRRLFGQAEGGAPLPEVSDSVDFTRHVHDRALLHGALRSLDDRTRSALLLRFFAGLDYDELAAVLGLTSSGARSRVFWGLRRMAELLASEEGGES